MKRLVAALVRALCLVGRPARSAGAPILRRASFAAALACAALLVACSSYSYLKVAHMTPAQMREASDIELCNAYNGTRAEPRTKQAGIREEMVSRNLLTEEEWQLVAERQLKAGMSKLALVACWGYPKRATRGMPAAGDTLTLHEQYMYEGSAGWSTISVYLEDDVVIGWREWSEVKPEEIEQSVPGVHSRPTGISREREGTYEPPAVEPQKGGMPGGR